MKLVQKLMSRGLTIGVIVAAVLAYNNRADIFPQWFGDKPLSKTSRAGSAPAMLPKHETTVAQEEVIAAPGDGAEVAGVQMSAQAASAAAAGSAPAAPVAETHSADTSTSGTSAPVAPAAEIAAPAPAPAAVAEASPVESAAAPMVAVTPGDSASSVNDGDDQRIRYRPEEEGADRSAEAAAAMQDSDGVTSLSRDNAAEAEPVSEAAAGTAADTASPVDDMPAAPTPVEVMPPQLEPEDAAPLTPAAEPVQHEAANGEALAQARAAYWSGDYAAAEQAYQQAVGVDETNPDIYGELGNLYYAQGKWKEAASAYFEAGTRLIGNGDRDRVQHLLVVMRGLDQDLAGRLEKMTVSP